MAKTYIFVTMKLFTENTFSKTKISRRSFLDLGRIPYNLLYVPEQEKPKFSDMVLYNFHKSRLIIEQQLINTIQPKYLPAMPQEVREQKVKEIMGVLNLHDSVLDLSFPFRRDNGTYELIFGYKAHHKCHKLPVRSGIRFSMDVERNKIMALATLATYTYTFANIPFGGAAGGLKINPLDYSDSELRHITNKFVVEMYRKGFMAPSVDVSAPEKGTRQKEMSWMADFYMRTYGYGDIYARTCVTGKALPIGGVHGFQTAASDGVFLCSNIIINNEGIMKKIGLSPSFAGKTYLIQGCGYIGSTIIRHLERVGAKLLGIQTSRGSIINKDGISGKDVIAYRRKTNTIVGFPGAQEYPIDKNILEEPCDIIILAAAEQAITANIAKLINTKIIVEASNGGITPGADSHLLKKNILVLPDMLTNCGAVAASFMEWVSCLQPIVNIQMKFRRHNDILFLKSVEEALNRQEYNLKIEPLERVKNAVKISREDLTYAALEFTAERACEKILRVAEEFELGIDLRTAAYVGAIRDVFRDVYNYIY